MTFFEAALAALYPVMIVLGVTIWARYYQTLKALDGGTRALVCSNLIIVGTNILEQILYGYGRFLGKDIYITVSMTPFLVGALKVGYILGFSYMLYAFWLLAPSRPRMWVPFLMSFVMWIAVTVALLV